MIIAVRVEAIALSPAKRWLTGVVEGELKVIGFSEHETQSHVKRKMRQHLNFCLLARWSNDLTE
jgi:hypothetical protein